MKSSNAMRHGLALACVASALAAPIASAAPAEQFYPSDVDDEPSRGAPVRVVEMSPDDGFDWGDAGIGASGLLALAAIGTGAMVLIRHRAGPGHPVT